MLVVLLFRFVGTAHKRAHYLAVVGFMDPLRAVALGHDPSGNTPTRPPAHFPPRNKRGFIMTDHEHKQSNNRQTCHWPPASHEPDGIPESRPVRMTNEPS